VPGIHEFDHVTGAKTWMAGTSPAMTGLGKSRIKNAFHGFHLSAAGLRGAPPGALAACARPPGGRGGRRGGGGGARGGGGLRSAAGTQRIDVLVYGGGAPASGSSTATFLPWWTVDPADPEHVLVGAYGTNAGLYEITATGGSWASYGARVEQDLPNQGISGKQLGPWVIGMAADWAAGAVYLSHSRGILRATPGDGAWDLEILGSDAVVDGDEVRWSGTGLDDTCALSLAADPDGDVFLGVADGGVLRSRDQGASWLALEVGVVEWA